MLHYGNGEVGYMSLARCIEHDKGRLQTAVRDAISMSIRKSVAHRSKPLHHSFCARARRFFQPIGEVSAVEHLQADITNIVCLPIAEVKRGVVKLKNLADIRVRQHTRDACFALKLLEVFGI